MPNLNKPDYRMRVSSPRGFRIIKKVEAVRGTASISCFLFSVFFLLDPSGVFGQLNFTIKTDQYYVVPDNLLGTNTILYPDFLVPDPPCTECENSNTGSPCPGEESFSCGGKDGGCVGQWRTMLADDLKDNVHSLGFKSIYFPFGSLNRYWHYIPGASGYCINSDEANQLAEWGSSKGKEDSDPQRQYCNQNSYGYANFFEANAELCKNDIDPSKSMHLVISANVYFGQWSELKSMLEYCAANQVIVDAIIFGTEIENDKYNIPMSISADGDTIPFPSASSYFRRVQRVYIDSLKASPIYRSLPLYFASAIQHDSQGGCEERNYTCIDSLGYDSDWNLTLHNEISNYNQTHLTHLRYAGAVNWWWFPITNSETDPSPEIAINDMNDFFDIGLSSNGSALCYKYPKGNAGGPVTGFDELLVDQWGIKKFQNPCPGTPYENTFLNHVFILKRVFNMLDNNYNMLYNPSASNGVTYTGAFFSRLGANNSYNPLDLDSEGVAWDTMNTSNFALKQVNSFSGYKFKRVTISDGPDKNLEAYYFFNCNDQKLVVINYTGTEYKINSLIIDDSVVAKTNYVDYYNTFVEETSSKGALTMIDSMKVELEHLQRQLKVIKFLPYSITTINIPITKSPATAEICNNIDDNCDGAVDENAFITCYLDKDGDGFGDSKAPLEACPVPNGYVTNSSDCNDDPTKEGWLAYPGATEICNGLDDNCNGSADDYVQMIYYLDADGDGYGTSTTTYTGCPHPDEYVSSNTDCNDNASAGGAAIYPGATEACNSIDDNCNGIIDENAKLFFFADKDGDGYGSGPLVERGCTASAGLVANNTDCNDDPASGGANIFPGQVELCNSIDDNCDGATDDIIAATIDPPGDISECSNTDIILTANGGTGISYQWLKNNVAILGATDQIYVATKKGDYKVTESNIYGCSSTSAITHITIIDKPNATITPLGDLNICLAGSVVLQANSGVGYTYKWKKGNNKISGATNQTYVATKTGKYKVVVTNSEGCSKTSPSVQVIKACKAGEESNMTALSVYPNPTGSNFTIDLNFTDDLLATAGTADMEATIQLMNELGQVVHTESAYITDGVLQKNISFTDSDVQGIYMVRVIAGNSIYSTQIVYHK